MVLFPTVFCQSTSTAVTTTKSKTKGKTGKQPLDPTLPPRAEPGFLNPWLLPKLRGKCYAEMHLKAQNDNAKHLSTHKEPIIEIPSPTTFSRLTKCSELAKKRGRGNKTTAGHPQTVKSSRQTGRKVRTPPPQGKVAAPSRRGSHAALCRTEHRREALGPRLRGTASQVKEQ